MSWMRFLEHAMRRRIGHHQRGEPFPVRGCLASQVGDVDVAVACARDDHDAHAGHHRACRVGAVRRGGYEHDVACSLATIAVVRANDHQAREFALRPGIRLQRHRCESGDLAQRCFELTEHLLVAGRLLHRRERDAAVENSGHVIGSISDAAFSFIVQEPSGIIEVSRPMSFRSSLRMYRIISVSE